MGQPVVFFEVISKDAERAQKFYADLFGWQVAAEDFAEGEPEAGHAPRALLRSPPASGECLVATACAGGLATRMT